MGIRCFFLCVKSTKYVMYWTFLSRGIQHEDTGDACSLTYWYSYCIFWSDQRCSWLKAYVLSHSYFPLYIPFFSNQILSVNWYSFYCLWILYVWFLTLLNIDCFSLMISFDCRAKCSVAASIKWAFKFFLFTNVPQPITLHSVTVSGQRCWWRLTWHLKWNS